MCNYLIFVNLLKKNFYIIIKKKLILELIFTRFVTNTVILKKSNTYISYFIIKKEI